MSREPHFGHDFENDPVNLSPYVRPNSQGFFSNSTRWSGVQLTNLNAPVPLGLVP